MDGSLHYASGPPAPTFTLEELPSRKESEGLPQIVNNGYLPTQPDGLFQFLAFLQVFDEGRLTDSKGRTADAKNAIFIMTSNIAADRQDRPVGFGFQDTEESQTATLREVQRRFRPEFLNRVDEQIVFRSLDEEDIRKILRPMLEEIEGSLQKQHNVTLMVTGEAEQFLAQAGYSPAYGARELRRTVERLLQVPLSQMILRGEARPGSQWQVVCADDPLSIIPTGDDPLKN